MRGINRTQMTLAALPPFGHSVGGLTGSALACSF